MDTITKRSRRHGPRTFTRTGSRPYRRLDGTMTTLAIWRCACGECGDAFEITAPAGATANNSGSFGVMHCPAHRRGPRAAQARRRAGA
jgi:hypothetical protein